LRLPPEVIWGQAMTQFSVYDLERRIAERATESPDISYTRKLLDRGVAQCSTPLSSSFLVYDASPSDAARASMVAARS